MVNQCQFLMGCCYNEEDLLAIDKKKYFIGVVRENDKKPGASNLEGIEGQNNTTI
tara:strand:+ start:447 stop:611 length:165 start_codon:yes stop_codon:yes gene_type:complete